ncbi:hypothetical protein RGQ21_67410 [Kitasatospora aureofaciens]|nr:hypothetical protein RGQ21_67410 [Kitasatospora aureofaciens]
MARNLFGGTAADAAEDITGARVPGAEGTVWNGPGAEALQVTDLLDFAKNPIMTLTANAEGMVNHFYGPDNVTLLYVDFGAGRVAMAPVNTSTDLANHLNAADPHGAKAGAVAEINAQKGVANGFAGLGPNGKVPASQLPELGTGSGGSVDWLNVKSAAYGAVGDGVQDDTASILSAVADAPYGGTVYFPPGIYKVSQPIDLPRGVSLRGAHSNLMLGPGMAVDEWACYLQAAPTFTTGAMITIIGEDDGDHPAINGEQRITNLMLDGSKTPTGGLDGIYARGNVQNVVLRDVCIRQMPNNGIVTASDGATQWPYSWRLHSVMVDNCHVNGMVFEGNTDLTLEDCQVIGCWSTGFKLTNCANTIVTHSRAEWNGNYGFWLTGGWGNWPGSGAMSLVNCSTDRNGWDGVRHDASGNGAFLIQGLMTRRDGRNGGPGGAGYAGLRLSGSAPVVATGVTCYVGTDDGGTAGTSPDYGVRVTGAKDVQLDGAHLHALLQGLYDDGTNTRLSLGTNITTVVGNNYAEDRKPLNPFARTSSVSYSPKGVFASPSWGEFWKPKRDAAATGGKAKVLFVGDSITKGYYVSDLVNKNFVGLVRNGLQAKYGDGGSGLYSSNRSAAIIGSKPEAIAAWTANNSIISTTGTWTDTGLYWGPGISSIYADAAATATFRVRGSTVRIYTLAGVNTPNAGYTYSIDGGAPVAVPDPGLTSGSVRTTTVTGLTAGNHTVVISYNGTGGARLQLIGVSAENDTGIVVDNMGRSGAKTSDFFVSGTGNALWHGGTSYPADLVVYALGANDAAASVSLDTWSGTVYQMLNTIKAVNQGQTDILMLIQHRGNYGAGTFYSQYAARARGIAEEYGAALVNMWPIGRNSYSYWSGLGYWGDSTNPGAAGADIVHPSDAGHQVIADQLLPLLMG